LPEISLFGSREKQLVSANKKTPAMPGLGLVRVKKGGVSNPFSRPSLLRVGEEQLLPIHLEFGNRLLTFFGE